MSEDEEAARQARLEIEEAEKVISDLMDEGFREYERRQRHPLIRLKRVLGAFWKSGYGGCVLFLVLGVGILIVPGYVCPTKNDPLESMSAPYVGEWRRLDDERTLYLDFEEGKQLATMFVAGENNDNDGLNGAWVIADEFIILRFTKMEDVRLQLLSVRFGPDRGEVLLLVPYPVDEAKLFDCYYEYVEPTPPDRRP